MHVIRRTSGGEQRNVFRLGRARQVAAKFVNVGDEIGALLGAEDAMHQHPRMSVRHMIKGRPSSDWTAVTSATGPRSYAVPGGTRVLFYEFPALKRWAQMCC